MQASTTTTTTMSNGPERHAHGPQNSSTAASPEQPVDTLQQSALARTSPSAPSSSASTALSGTSGSSGGGGGGGSSNPSSSSASSSNNNSARSDSSKHGSSSRTPPNAAGAPERITNAMQSMSIETCSPLASDGRKADAVLQGQQQETTSCKSRLPRADFPASERDAANSASDTVSDVGQTTSRIESVSHESLNLHSPQLAHGHHRNGLCDRTAAEGQAGGNLRQHSEGNTVQAQDQMNQIRNQDPTNLCATEIVTSTAAADRTQGHDPPCSRTLSNYVEETMMVPRQAVGFVIGRKGDTIKRMIEMCGAHIEVDREEDHAPPSIHGPAANRPFLLAGTPDQVAHAKRLVREKIAGVLHSRYMGTMGSAGAADTGSSQHFGTPSSPTAHLGTRQSQPPGDGSEPQLQYCDDGESFERQDSLPSHLARPGRQGETNLPSPSRGECESDAGKEFEVGLRAESDSDTLTVEMWVPRSRVGSIIGQGGMVIAGLQSRAGATIVVHNGTVNSLGDKLLTISGGPAECEEGRRLVADLLARPDIRERPYVGAGRVGDGGGNNGSNAGIGSVGDRPGNSPFVLGGPGGSGQAYSSPGPPSQGSAAFSMGGHFSPYPTAGLAVKRVCVPSSCVGIVIGKGGETIRDLQTRSGAYIKVTPDDDAGKHDLERILYISGTPNAIELAHNLLNDIVNEGLRRSYRDGAEPPASASSARPPRRRIEDSDASNEGSADTAFASDLALLDKYPSNSISVRMHVPNAKVGVIIGKGGQTIRELQQRSGARIVISKRIDTTREDNPRAVTITGPKPFVDAAQALIGAKVQSPGVDMSIPSPSISGDAYNSLSPGVPSPVAPGSPMQFPSGGFGAQVSPYDINPYVVAAAEFNMRHRLVHMQQIQMQQANQVHAYQNVQAQAQARAQAQAQALAQAHAQAQAQAQAQGFSNTQGRAHSQNQAIAIHVPMGFDTPPQAERPQTNMQYVTGASNFMGWQGYPLSPPALEGYESFPGNEYVVLNEPPVADRVSDPASPDTSSRPPASLPDS